MCCFTHNKEYGAGQYRIAEADNIRCRCPNHPPCPRYADGEDIRCPVCRNPPDPSPMIDAGHSDAADFFQSPSAWYAGLPLPYP